MSNRRHLLLFVALMSVLTLGATPARAGFDDVVRAVESRYHVRHTGIPFFGLVRFAIWVAQPAGVSDVQLATFEHARIDDERGLAEIVSRNIGEGFRPLVRTRSSRNGEVTQIYAHPMGNDRVALLVFAHERAETTIVRVVVSMDKFEEAMNKPDSVLASIR
ncbi:MAG TPA: hypothetical protein VHX14_02565 [Thermoanaerobaculia bacterium]|jgi:hypothetical protein|nr:hypothetical protein [Thermoanaerobaculia bacterium]